MFLILISILKIDPWLEFHFAIHKFPWLANAPTSSHLTNPFTEFLQMLTQSELRSYELYNIILP